MRMLIRPSRPDDIPALLAIYNAEVRNSTVTLDTRERSLSEWQEWAAHHSTPRYPLLVAEVEGQAVGYATLSPYRHHDGYAPTAELSVYVAATHRRGGIGRALIAAIIAYAEQQHLLRTIVSVVTSDNEASDALHRSLGFRYCGRIHDVGRKLGRIVSIDHFERQIN